MALLFAPALSHESLAGKVLVLGDDWMLSDYAFDIDPNGTGLLASGLADFLVGEAPASFLVVSDTLPEIPFGPRGLLGNELAQWMGDHGHSWTIDPLADLDFANLASYDALMLGGQVASGEANAIALQKYVLAGGSVLLVGGTGDFGSAQNEADAWAPFLSRFGLSLGNELLAADPGALTQLPVQVETEILPPALASVVWGQGQLAVADVPSNPRTSVFLQGDFAGLGGVSQATLNDVGVAYDSPFLPGDFNDDGRVDAADYTSWRDSQGTTALLAGDATPNSIDAADYETWRLNYGRTAPMALTAATTVPEPCTTGLVAMSAILCWSLAFHRT
ncbi:hypothetical protein [Botrimarina mediterranea]|uniref:Glutamine amidotransferase domain-containing protein n=1 Tax=Botrimarina mediterranea TaxID=2528022 RepID=A0A518KBI3_9BACT|nr:hypothetical protein [Botrimarina mediterranea]QDV75138.1 hypothetical protein Spa11_33480 [Botrimarina mediterranea]QDV79784.1 hypothetical protein K2D_34000 [Planctomycetes bacterium K2D]